MLLSLEKLSALRYTLTMEGYINPLSDMLIKYILGREENKDLLLDFINAVQEDKGFSRIKEVTIKNPFNLKEFQTDKYSVVDIKALDENNHHYNIEIQTYTDRHFFHRSLYYWAKIYSSQLGEAENYLALHPVISINLLDFSLLKNIRQLHSCYMLFDLVEKEIPLTDHLQLHFIETSKNYSQSASFGFQKWIDYFKFEGKGDDSMETLLKEYPILQKAHHAYQKFTSDDESRELYEQRLKAQRNIDSIVETAVYNAKAETKAETEHEMAKRMKDKKIDISVIMDVTGLSADEIEKL